MHSALWTVVSVRCIHVRVFMHSALWTVVFVRCIHIRVFSCGAFILTAAHRHGVCVVCSRFLLLEQCCCGHASIYHWNLRGNFSKTLVLK